MQKKWLCRKSKQTWVKAAALCWASTNEVGMPGSNPAIKLIKLVFWSHYLKEDVGTKVCHV